MQLEYPIVNYLRKVNGQHIVNQQLQLGVYFSTEIMLHNGRINQQVIFFCTEPTSKHETKELTMS